MFNSFFRWLTCQKAATAVEYALLAAGIAAACLAAMFALGDSFELIMQSLSDALSGPEV